MGRFTILLARLRAFFERDLKKIVALSTLSQLGVIVVRLGVGEVALRFFHLLAHAFFKAILFAARGTLIHNSINYQDLRLIGNKISNLPLSTSIVLVSSLRLCGLPFISAYFTKEAILEKILLKKSFLLIYLIFFLGVGITLFYRIRLALFGISRF